MERDTNLVNAKTQGRKGGLEFIFINWNEGTPPLFNSKHSNKIREIGMFPKEVSVQVVKTEPKIS